MVGHEDGLADVGVRGDEVLDVGGGDEHPAGALDLVGVAFDDHQPAVLGSSVGIALVASLFFAVLAASGEQYGTALATGLGVVLACVLAAFALGLADVLRRRRDRTSGPGDLAGVATGTATAPDPHAAAHGHPHH